MEPRQTIRIKIFGTEYVLRGDSDAGYMQELAQMVDQKMRQHGQPGSVQVNRVAILTAFQFADEWMKTRKSLESLRQSQDQAARRMAQLDLKIQEALKPGAPDSRPVEGITMEVAEQEETGDSGDPELEPENAPAVEDEGDDDMNWK